MTKYIHQTLGNRRQVKETRESKYRKRKEDNRDQETTDGSDAASFTCKAYTDSLQLIRELTKMFCS